LRLDTANSRPDLLRWPVIGVWLRWRHARTSIQVVLLVVAAVVVLHGLFGPQIAPTNFATVLTWVHYRGLLVVALLAAGNFFCTGCPFVLVRDLGRRMRPPTRRWPRLLRTKWIAIVLFIAVLFAYELFDLWALPRGTAYLVLAYFGTAFVIDLVFTGATFCKYLCPIGQFNFVASVVSPLELHVREPDTCRSCQSHDCIRGRRLPDAPSVVTQRGCELGLFLPTKVGNLDCTFCLDCVQACPHDNIGLLARLPAAELADDRRRSGIGRLIRRRDLAALAVIFTFAALLNAFGMTAPAYGVQAWLRQVMGGASETVALAALFVLSLGVVPVMLIGVAAMSTWCVSRNSTRSVAQTAVRYSYALIPFGFGVWVAHYGFHVLTGALTVVPVTQNAVVDLLGWPALGDPLWQWTGMRPGAVFPIQIGLILLGTLGSLAVAYRISERDQPDRPGLPTLSWAIVTVVLATMAIWTLSQPMEMRGVGFPG
jgi:polyferredoxin